jgi:hypothetical protein
MRMSGVVSCEALELRGEKQKLSRLCLQFFPCKVANFINGDAGGDGGVHRAQRILATGQLDLDVRPRCRRGRAPPPIGHTLIL